jgi:peptide/nickel transport system ATP-binding protein
MNGDTLLSVGIDAAYAGKPALRDIRFDLQRGEIFGLVGTSGAGKSTLVLSLLGLLRWRGGRVSGSVSFEGRELLGLAERRWRELRGRRIALIPQSPMTALNAAISLESHFKEAWKAHDKSGSAALRARLRELLEEVQLPASDDFLRRRPGEISVGQAQRVLIALALLHRPSLIIADEPTSALDPVTQTQIIGLLKRLNRQLGATLLYISHDLVSVLQLADRIAVLSEGSIVENLPVDRIDQARHPSAQALLHALPVPPDVLLGYRDREEPEPAELALARP